jgi:hypothetical protein
MTTANVGIRSGNVVIPYVSSTKRTKVVTLTYTSTPAGWTSDNSRGFAFADSNGVWWLTLSISANMTAATSGDATISGVTFAAFYQALANFSSTALTSRAFTNPSNGTVSVQHSVNNVSFYTMGTVQLASEPTWASANMEGVIAADVYIANYIPGTSPGLVPSTGLPPGETYTNTAASGAGAVTIDFSTSVLQRLVLTGNCALTLTAAALPETCILMLVQDGTGTRIPTWTTTVKWAGGTAPTLSTAINSVDIITFARINSVWYGMFNLDFK